MVAFNLHILGSFVTLHIEHYSVRVIPKQLVDHWQSLLFIQLHRIKFSVVLQDLTRFRAPKPIRILLVQLV